MSIDILIFPKAQIGVDLQILEVSTYKPLGFGVVSILYVFYYRDSSIGQWNAGPLGGDGTRWNADRCESSGTNADARGRHQSFLDLDRWSVLLADLSFRYFSENFWRRMGLRATLLERIMEVECRTPLWLSGFGSARTTRALSRIVD